ncbi:unnamed protein product [Linum tenue]|uniref:Protein FAR1-RELATED SEQUENCE n=1 Tax=Linum tenue TaxID=586396 RepID=A0AAV0QPY8_9ROSI|nr:unnamed protein product [Linum tenue]
MPAQQARIMMSNLALTPLGLWIMRPPKDEALCCGSDQHRVWAGPVHKANTTVPRFLIGPRGCDVAVVRVVFILEGSEELSLAHGDDIQHDILTENADTAAQSQSTGHSRENTGMSLLNVNVPGNIEDWGFHDLKEVTFDSVDEADNFYNNYSKKREAKAVTRFGCLASFKVKFDKKDGKYKVEEFVSEHNHDRVGPEQVQFLRSHRSLNEGDKAQVESLRGVGVKPSQIMDLRVNEVGGYDNVGFTLKDLYNFVDGGKHPSVVITDGCMSMKRAIKELIPGASHRICCWHLRRNAESNVSPKEFLKVFDRLLKRIDSVDEFEEVLRKVVPSSLVVKRWSKDAKKECHVQSVHPELQNEELHAMVRSGQDVEACLMAARLEEVKQ